VAAIEALRLQLASFEGPLPLLLHLIERKALEVTSVSVVEVADQFLALVAADQRADLAITSEFLAMAARLVLLKSRALLHMPYELTHSAEETLDDAEALAAQLRVYGHIQEASRWLGVRQEAAFFSLARPISQVVAPTPTLMWLDAALLPRRARALFRGITPDQPALASPWPEVSFGEVRARLVSQIHQVGAVTFSQISDDAWHPLVVITLFLAMLDAIRTQLIVAEQVAPYGPITLLPFEVATA
jgi:segregation and condensation protein A